MPEYSIFEIVMLTNPDFDNLQKTIRIYSQCIWESVKGNL